MPKLTWTHTTLREALQDWIEDDFSDFTGELDVVIGMGERRCYRDLDLTIHDKRDTAPTTSSGDPLLAKPADCITVRSLYVNGQFLTPRSREYVEMITADAASNAQPVYFAEEDETNLRLGPTPDGTYSSVFVYDGTPDGMSSGTQTSWLGDNQPDLLFKACLVEAENFIDDEEDRGRYDAEYERLKNQAKEETKHLRRSDFMRVAMIPPALPRPLP